MPSELDLRFAATMAAMTAPDGPLPIARDERGQAVAPAFPATLGAFFRHFCAAHGEADAIVAGDERLSFAALDALSEELAGALAGAHGVRPGDRVAIAMRNCPVWVIAYMAVVKAGGIATLVNGWWTPAELAHGLALTRPVLVIADAERARRATASGWAGRVSALDVTRPAREALGPLLEGARGTGGFYALGRRLRALAGGKGFEEDHSARDAKAAGR